MKNLTVNFKERKIEMTKAFEKKASAYGSAEYNQLLAIRRDYPDFTITTISNTKKKDSFKGLTYDKMKMYIQKHDDKEQTIMHEFNVLRGKEENAEGYIEACSYGEIREWFLNTYPEVKDVHKNRNKKVNEIKEKARQNYNDKTKQKTTLELVDKTTENIAG